MKESPITLRVDDKSGIPQTTPPPDIPKFWKQKFRVPANLRSYRDPMFDLAPDPCQIVVEIGSMWGHWAYRACRELPNAVVFCIDPWPDEKRGKTRYGKNLGWDAGIDNFREWAMNVMPFLKEGRIHAIKGKSADIARLWKRKIDFLFIDGDHSARGVRDDLQNWFPKMAPGGLLVGHDWDGVWATQVRAGVLTYFSRDEFEVDKLYHSGRKLGECYWKRT